MNRKVALVTGSNQGIGLATVALLLAQNVDVILTSRSIDKGNTAAPTLPASKHLHVHQLDVNDASSVKHLYGYAEATFGKLDILVNNAGVNYDTWQRVTNANIDEVQDTFSTNVFGAWRMAKTFLPLLKKSGSGGIVNVSSGGGALSAQNGGTPGYSLSKLAMNGLTMQLASSLRENKITVNSVCPGWVRTQMGGMGADRSPTEGADTVVWAALNEDKTLTGKFLRDRKVIAW